MSGGRIGMTLARVSVTLALALSAAMTTGARTDSPQPAGIPRFELPASGLRLERPTRQGAFVDIVGWLSRSSATSTVVSRHGCIR